MLDVMDEVAASAPQASLTLYVDDATAEASGSRRQVAATLARATAVLADGVAAAGLEVSTSKSVVVASHRRIRRQVGRARASCGGRLVRAAHVAKMLGCGTAGGRRRSTHVQQLRLKRARLALPRIAALRRAGVSTACWWRTAGNPSMLSGTDTLWGSRYGSPQPASRSCRGHQCPWCRQADGRDFVDGRRSGQPFHRSSFRCPRDACDLLGQGSLG